MNLENSQSELRYSFVHGGPGTCISGVVWLIAGIVVTFSNVATGFAVLFFGGMLIFPTATLVVRMLFGRAPVSPGNPGGLIVVETIFPMIGGLFAAWLLLPFRPEFVFPLAAIAVGAHYFGFRSAYGDKTFWVLAAIMCLIGAASIIVKIPTSNVVVFLIAGTEVVFGIWLTWRGIVQKEEQNVSE